MAAVNTDAGTPLAVQARGVRVRLGGHEILHDVDVDAEPGKAVAIMGGNGSGKSTLVRALVGALPLSGGSVLIYGKERSRATSRRVGYVPQRMGAGAGVSANAIEVVTSGLLGAGRLMPPRDAKKLALEALDDLGVKDLAHKNVAELSGGQQQRVLIARAMVRKPELLILDEPMAGVDIPSQEALAQTLQRHIAGGGGLVIVLHELGALESLIDHAVVLEQGCVTHVGEPPRGLGVHALPGHDHEHAHADVPEPPASPFAWEVRK